MIAAKDVLTMEGEPVKLEIDWTYDDRDKRPRSLWDLTVPLPEQVKQDAIERAEKTAEALVTLYGDQLPDDWRDQMEEALKNMPTHASLGQIMLCWN